MELYPPTSIYILKVIDLALRFTVPQKSSVIQVTKYFAVLLAGRNININCLSPGGILNKKKQSQKFINSYRKNVPLKRMANIEDIFSGVLYLTSDSSSYITGQNIVIDGGLSLK